MKELKAIDIVKKIRQREVSAEETARYFSQQIEKENADINAFISTDEKIIESARRVDEKLAKGEACGILSGLPIGVKDNINLKGMRMTCGSKFLENFISPYDATVIAELRKADALLIGKTNMDEFAVGGSNENSYFGSVRNPVDRKLVPGGSSGGSAAAVASGMVPLALGTDTGGSIRQPAAFCGIVGVKPTYGTVSRYGIVSMANSLDQAGTFAHNILDAFFLLSVISGMDPKDSTSSAREILTGVDYFSEEDLVAEAFEKIKGMRIAVPKEFFTEELDVEIKECVLQAAHQLENLGAQLEETKFASKDYFLPAYYTIATSELSSNLSRFDGIRYGHRAEDYEDLKELYARTRGEAFGAEVKRRILVGAYATSNGFENSYYRKALQARTAIIKDFNHIFERFDLVLAPTSPVLPYALGTKVHDVIAMYLADLYTVPVNLAGICGISIPCGQVQGLPVGMQLMADRFCEKHLLNAGLAFERRNDR